jgi:L-ascorbate metabolism protein UlaG (beta-lactamase superfamily)
MTITWLGHACFRVEEDGWSVVLDPYTDVRGYPPLSARADAVLCSHDHFDHNYRRGVTLPETPRRAPFPIDTLSTWHDEKQGKLRGSNTVHILRMRGGTVVHLGDLGHLLSAEQAAALRGCDVLLLPVGGTYTINATAARRVMEQIQPRIAVPMHYRREELGFAELGTAEAFLALFPAERVHRLETNTFSPEEMEPGLVLPARPV